MANCCLLIETYISFTVPSLMNTHRYSEKCFGYFFVTNPRFHSFSTGGLSATRYADIHDRTKDNGIPMTSTQMYDAVFYIMVKREVAGELEGQDNYLILSKSKLMLQSS